MITDVEVGDTYIIPKVYYLKDMIVTDDAGHQKVVTQEQGLRYQVVPVVAGKPVHDAKQIKTFETLSEARLEATGERTCKPKKKKSQEESS